MAEILVDGVVTEIEAKPITLLCHRGDVRLDPYQQVEIGPEQTLAFVAGIRPNEWAAIRVAPVFEELFRIVFPDMPMPYFLHQEGTGVRHVTGLILMVLELEPGQQPYFRMPESFLHPAAQSRMADLLIRFSGAGQVPALPA